MHRRRSWFLPVFTAVAVAGIAAVYVAAVIAA
jgi:hypothetical protein